MKKAKQNYDTSQMIDVLGQIWFLYHDGYTKYDQQLTVTKGIREFQVGLYRIGGMADADSWLILLLGEITDF